MQYRWFLAALLSLICAAAAPLGARADQLSPSPAPANDPTCANSTRNGSEYIVYQKRNDYERELEWLTASAKMSAACVSQVVDNAGGRYKRLDEAATLYSLAADLAAQLHHNALARSYAQAANAFFRTALELGQTGQVFEFLHSDDAATMKANIQVNDDLIERLPP